MVKGSNTFYDRIKPFNHPYFIVLCCTHFSGFKSNRNRVTLHDYVVQRDSGSDPKFNIGVAEFTKVMDNINHFIFQIIPVLNDYREALLIQAYCDMRAVARRPPVSFLWVPLTDAYQVEVIQGIKRLQPYVVKISVNTSAVPETFM